MTNMEKSVPDCDHQSLQNFTVADLVVFDIGIYGHLLGGILYFTEKRVTTTITTIGLGYKYFCQTLS